MRPTIIGSTILLALMTVCSTIAEASEPDAPRIFLLELKSKGQSEKAHYLGRLVLRPDGTFEYELDMDSGVGEPFFRRGGGTWKTSGKVALLTWHNTLFNEGLVNPEPATACAEQPAFGTCSVTNETFGYGLDTGGRKHAIRLAEGKKSKLKYKIWFVHSITEVVTTYSSWTRTHHREVHRRLLQRTPIKFKLYLRNQKPPVVKGARPAALAVGEELTVTGKRFHEGAVVRIGGIEAATTWVSKKEVRAIVPKVDGPVEVLVAHPDGKQAVCPNTINALRAPRIRVRFPPGGSYTSAERLSVTGRAIDASPVVSVEVNGVPATSDDGFATWRAEVPLAPGQNRLVVSAEDAEGMRNAEAGVVVVDRAEEADTVIPWGLWMVVTTFDHLRGRLFDIDTDQDLTHKYTWETGAAWSTLHVAKIYGYHRGRDSLLYPWKGALRSFRLVGGEITDLSGPDRGSGPPISDRGLRLFVDPGQDRVLIQSYSDPYLMSVDLETGDRAAVTPAAPFEYHDIGDVAVDPGSGTILVGHRYDLEVWRLVPATGSRDLVYKPASVINRSAGLSFDDVGNRFLLVEETGTLWALDPETGEKTEISGPNRGRGTEMLRATGVLAVPGWSVAVVDTYEDEESPRRDLLYAVELVSGDRVVVAR